MQMTQVVWSLSVLSPGYLEIVIYMVTFYQKNYNYKILLRPVINALFEYTCKRAAALCPIYLDPLVSLRLVFLPN